MERKGDCQYCRNAINFNEDKYVLLGTYKGRKTGRTILDEGYFHFDCFVEWYNKQVLAKATNVMRGFQKKAQGLFSQLANSGVLNHIAGADNLQRMLNTDLGDQEVEIGEFESGVPTVEEMFGGEEKKKKKAKTKKKKKTFKEEVAELPQ